MRYGNPVSGRVERFEKLNAKKAPRVGGFLNDVDLITQGLCEQEFQQLHHLHHIPCEQLTSLP